MGQQTYDVHADITTRIVAAIKRGAGTLQMPWRDGTAMRPPINATTTKAYRGINVLSLWLTTQERAYASCEWATFKQWQSHGAMVRKGEKGTPIIFYKTIERDGAEGEDADDPRTIPFAHASWVFNASQVDGYAPQKAPAPSAPLFERLRQAEPAIAATQAAITYGGSRAFYQRTEDRIQVPAAEDFTGTPTSTAREAFYSTIFHELGHWSGAEKRLNRVKGKRFAYGAYAFKEIIAELSAAFTCARLGISDTPRPDHAQYIEQYPTILRNDKKAIFAAATAATVAADDVLAFSVPRQEPAD